MASDALSQRYLLLLRAKLKELLDDIIAKDVCHEAPGRGQDLCEHSLLLYLCCTLQLLLDEARAVLILGELDDVLLQVSKLQVGTTIVTEVIEELASS